MKRTPFLILAAAVGLSACADQPAEPEEPTATVTETVTPERTDVIPTNQTITAAIGELQAGTDPEQLPTGDNAVERFTNLLVPEDADVEESCREPVETSPSTAGFGPETETVDDDLETQALAAFGFAAEDTAESFTDDLQGFVQDCQSLSATDDDADEPGEGPTRHFTLESLTHHTDEAFEIQVDGPEDYLGSLVVLRDDHIVLAVSSTPPNEVSLSLTLADQLDQMLR